MTTTVPHWSTSWDTGIQSTPYTYTFNNHFNIILPSTSISLSRLLLSGLPIKSVYTFITYSTRATSPLHFTLICHFEDTCMWWFAQIMKFLTTELCPTFCFSLSLVQIFMQDKTLCCYDWWIGMCSRYRSKRHLSVADARTAVLHPTVVTRHKLDNATLSISNDCL